MTFSCVCLSLSLSVSLPAELQTVCKIFHKRISGLEADKYDLEWKNKMKYLEVNTARLRIEILFFFYSRLTHTPSATSTILIYPFLPSHLPRYNLQTSDCIYFNCLSLSLFLLSFFLRLILITEKVSIIIFFLLVGTTLWPCYYFPMTFSPSFPYFHFDLKPTVYLCHWLQQAKTDLDTKQTKK